MSLPTGRIDVFAWALVYGGLGVACVGVALSQQGASYGWGAVACGLAAVAVGAVLLWARSRQRSAAADKGFAAKTPETP